MAVEAIGTLDADLARANSASQELAAALSQEHVGPDAKPGDIERARAAVQAAEAALAQAEAAVQADRAAPSISPEPPHVVDVVA